MDSIGISALGAVLFVVGFFVGSGFGWRFAVKKILTENADSFASIDE